MGYIYMIENTINSEKYIGQTKKDPWVRFKEHLSDKNRKRNKNRPLYMAMNKYDIINFDLTIIEEVDDDLLNDREIYWINYYDTYNNGYNATLGGNGKRQYDLYDKKIIEDYSNNLSLREIGRKYHMDGGTVKRILSRNGINIKKEYKYPILELDPENYEIKNRYVYYEDGFGAISKIAKIPTARMLLTYRYRIILDSLWITEKDYNKLGVDGIKRLCEKSTNHTNNGISKKVIELNSNKIFNSITQASFYFDKPLKAISRCCHEESTIIDDNNQELVFRFL